MHLALQAFGAIERLIARTDRVTLICGRDVIGRLREQFPAVTLRQITVPTERQYRLEEDAKRHTRPHYPDVFHKTIADIQVEGPHHLFLIGAGFLGKVYCGEVKRKGGFALDIGSVFDYWGEVPHARAAAALRTAVWFSRGESLAGIYLGKPAADPDLIGGVFRTCSATWPFAQCRRNSRPPWTLRDGLLSLRSWRRRLSGRHSQG